MPAFVAEAHGWARRPLEAVTLELTGQTYAALMWAEPEIASTADTARNLRQHALPSTTLTVIASGGLRRYLPAWQSNPIPAVQPLAPGAAKIELHLAGWRVGQPEVAFHGSRSMAWTRLA